MALITGSTQISNIDPTNLKEVKQVAQEINNVLAEQDTYFSAHISHVSDLAKLFKNYKHEISEVKQISTKINHLNDRILNITDSLGYKKVKEAEVSTLINKNATSRNQLENQLIATQAKRQQELNYISNQLQQNNITQQDHNDLVTKLNTEYQTTVDFIEAAKEQNKAQEVALQKINSRLVEANNQADRFTRKANILTGLFRSLSKIPIIGPLLDAEELSNKAILGRKQLMGELRTQLSNILKSPIALGVMAFAMWSKIFGVIKDIAKQVLALNEGITKISNNLGMSVETTRSLVSGFFNAGEAVDKLDGLLDSSFISMTNAVKAIGDLQEGFSTSAMFTKETIQAQILLTEQMGLSADEARGLQKYMFLAKGDTQANVTNSKDLLNSIVKQVSVQNKQFGVSLSYKKVLLEVSKISGELLASYKNNPELLAQAVSQAQRLGMTLEDTRKISESLLNFESSIENELKAELLIGKQLNYEKARSLALDGKSAEAAAELVSQFGGLEELTKLNVIQRKALAESIGLSADELVKSAQEQKIVNALGAENKQSLQDRYNSLIQQNKLIEAQNLLAEIQKQENGEILAQDIAKASLNQRLEQSINKIKEIFVDMASGPVISIVEGMVNLLKHTTAIKIILVGVAGAAAALASFLTTAAIAVTIATGGANVVKALAVSAGAGFLVGGGTMAGLLSLGSSEEESEAPVNKPPILVKDAAISPKGNLLISTPEGNMFKVGERDYVYTTPLPPAEMLDQRKSSPLTAKESTIKQDINNAQFEKINTGLDNLKNTITNNTNSIISKTNEAIVENKPEIINNTDIFDKKLQDLKSIVLSDKKDILNKPTELSISTKPIDELYSNIQKQFIDLKSIIKTDIDLSKANQTPILNKAEIISNIDSEKQLEDLKKLITSNTSTILSKVDAAPVTSKTEIINDFDSDKQLEELKGLITSKTDDILSKTNQSSITNNTEIIADLDYKKQLEELKGLITSNTNTILSKIDTTPVSNKTEIITDLDSKKQLEELKGLITSNTNTILSKTNQTPISNNTEIVNNIASDNNTDLKEFISSKMDRIISNTNRSSLSNINLLDTDKISRSMSDSMGSIITSTTGVIESLKTSVEAYSMREAPSEKVEVDLVGLNDYKVEEIDAFSKAINSISILADSMSSNQNKKTDTTSKESESIPLLREMVSLLKSKGYVYMDSRLVGETLGQSSTSYG